MWLIVGTMPEEHAGLETGECHVRDGGLELPSGRMLPVARGTAALLGTAVLACAHYGLPAPHAVLAGDIGTGAGSRTAYRYLTEHLASLRPDGITFHYLFPDVDWHNRVLMAAQSLEPQPLLVADAGFMYVAKMSGYADAYTLFTPDAGEMAFLADECAPHPFYTRGCLLDEAADVTELLERARRHGNCPPYLIVKGAVDSIAGPAGIMETVAEPCVPAMEAIGGTGDIITALVTVFLMRGDAVAEACLRAARCGRRLAALANPTPATQIGELLAFLPEALRREGEGV